MDQSEKTKDHLFSHAMNLLKFISPAIIVKPLTNTPEDVLYNGTFSHVNTGTHTVLVTAAHVYDEFRKQHEQDSTVEFAWFPAQGVNPIAMTDSDPTGHNRNEIDLCTFETKLSCPLSDVGKEWAGVKAWPPARPQKGDQIIGIGFPGSNRYTDNRHGTLGLAMVATVVSGTVGSVSDRHFVVSDEGLERFVVNFSGKEAPQNFGGMSGGIFFRVIPIDEKTDRLELAGFLYEVYDIHERKEDTHSSLYITHADFILPDGKLDEGLIPYS